MNKELLIKKIMSGEVVLITGAGFSADLKDFYGDHLPIGTSLAKEIWPLVFGSEPFDDSTSLSEIFQLALDESKIGLKEQLDKIFHVDPNSLPQRFNIWYQFPWKAVYTLNVDDSTDIIANQLADHMNIISTFSDSLANLKSNRLNVIHLNGRIDDFPNVTFTVDDFNDRMLNDSAIYSQFITDISTNHVLVIGSKLEEPPLWYHLRKREIQSHRKEMRPKSWYVSPNINITKRKTLQKLNFEFIDDNEEEFYEEYLHPNIINLRPEHYPENQVKKLPYSLVNELLEESRTKESFKDFLLGNAPTILDVTRGYAVEFDQDKDLIIKIQRMQTSAIILGTAGSGKTTSLLRIAVLLHAEGYKIGWMDSETSEHSSFGEILDSLKELDFILIDDFDRFSEQGEQILNRCKEYDTKIIVAMRHHRYIGLEYERKQLFEIKHILHELSPDDASNLIKALAAAHRLGALEGRSHQEQLKSFLRDSDRQLIVCLKEAVSGRKFDDIIADECEELRNVDEFIYIFVCLSMTLDGYLPSRDEIFTVGAMAEYTPEEVDSSLKKLLKSRILIMQNFKILARHRVISESSIRYYKSAGKLPKAVSTIIKFFYSKSDPIDPGSSKHGRLYIRLIKHDTIQNLVGTVGGREVYSNVEEILSPQSHFWLQRGSFETSYGDYHKANTFLNQAAGKSPEDIQIKTAKYYLSLIQSFQNRKKLGETENCLSILSELLPIAMEAHNSPHSCEVFIDFSLKLLKSKPPLEVAERIRLKDNEAYSKVLPAA